MNRNHLKKIILLLIAIFQSFYIYLFNLPNYALGQTVLPFRSANTTLNNSRFSYKATIAAGGVGANTTTVNIKNSGYTDNDTKNIFPNDDICFNKAGSNGCSENKTFSVASILSDTAFAVNTQVQSALAENDFAVASQTGRLTVTFTPDSTVSSGGFIRVQIPAATSNHSDGIPDSTGFDANKLVTGNVNAYITPTGFTKSTSSMTTSGGYHTILMTLSSALSAGTSYSFIIGDASDVTYRFINPTPSGTTHTRGVSDSYSIVLRTEDSSNVPINATTMKVNPIDGIMVSADIQLTLSYTIASVNIGTSACGNAMSVTTTATTVPFGAISSFDSFYDAAHTHTISTNAPSGYIITVLQDGDMSKDGGGTTTIPATVCNNSPACNTTTPQTWTTATNNGLGYTLANISGTDAVFTSGYKPFSTSAITIMSNNGKVSSSSVYSCYRLSVDTTQDAGYYFNKLTYVATPRF